MIAKSPFEDNLCRLKERAPDLGLLVTSGYAEVAHDPIDPGGAEVVYVHGLGQDVYDEMREWLQGDRERRLVFLEHEGDVIRSFLEGSAAPLSDPQVCFYPATEEILPRLFADFLGKQVAVAVAREYRSMGFKERLLVGADTGQRLHNEIRTATTEAAQNFLANLKHVQDSVWGADLFGKFTNVPAIVCGAGPSLDVEALRPLQDRALIFAGGSALNALSAKGLLPHFGAGLDPFMPQYSRVSANSAFEIPFFWTGRFQSDALNLISGPKIYLSGPDRASIALERAISRVGPRLDPGHNVTNWTVSIAEALGCSPIVLVGCDLAYTDNRAYADGVDPDHVWQAETERDGLKTEWKWIAEAEWMGQQQLVNATPRGLEIPGVPRVPLSDIEFVSSWPLNEWVHSELQKAGRSADVAPFEKDLRHSLAECGILLSQKNRYLLETELAYEIFLEDYQRLGVPIGEILACLT